MRMRLSKALPAGFLLVLFCALHTQAQTATVSWNNTDQVIDGFGASDYSSDAPSSNQLLTPAQAAFFFGTGPGDIGLSLFRTGVTDTGACTSVSSACAGVYVADMQLAIAQGAKIWSSPWSPPASMKSNNSTNCSDGSGNGTLLAGQYGAYANYLANYVMSLRTVYNINLYAISIQNEPEICQPYDSSLMTGAQFLTFIKTNLGPTFAANGLTSTLIVMPEVAGYYDLTNYAAATMGDSTAASYISINAWHDYDATYSPPNATSNPYASQGKKYWETEASAGVGFGPSLCGGCWDPSMADALMWAAIVHNRLADAKANAWNYWWLIDYYNNDNEGLIGPDGVTVSKRAYMLGNYSKFVRPGSYRIDATETPQSGVLVSAYKNTTTGALVIVVINQNGSNVSQSFVLNGATVSSVTPWITSGELNLAQQSDVAVSGGSFSYSLPAYSVTSFVGTTSSTSGGPTRPAPPGQLTATVR
jgi:glucuronoarabinoxylan endo-1,4-beta-xylanase